MRSSEDAGKGTRLRDFLYSIAVSKFRLPQAVADSDRPAILVMPRSQLDTLPEKDDGLESNISQEDKALWQTVVDSGDTWKGVGKIMRHKNRELLGTCSLISAQELVTAAHVVLDGGLRQGEHIWIDFEAINVLVEVRIKFIKTLSTMLHTLSLRQMPQLSQSHTSSFPRKTSRMRERMWFASGFLKQCSILYAGFVNGKGKECSNCLEACM